METRKRREREHSRLFGNLDIYHSNPWFSDYPSLENFLRSRMPPSIHPAARNCVLGYWPVRNYLSRPRWNEDYREDIELQRRVRRKEKFRLGEDYQQCSFEFARIKSRGKIDEFVSSNWKTETTTRRFIPLDSRHYSESASGTAAREHCYIVLRATVKAETRKDDEEEEEAGETATAFHHTASLPDPSFFPLLS